MIHGQDSLKCKSPRAPELRSIEDLCHTFHFHECFLCRLLCLSASPLPRYFKLANEIFNISNGGVVGGKERRNEQKSLHDTKSCAGRQCHQGTFRFCHIGVQVPCRRPHMPWRDAGQRISTKLADVWHERWHIGPDTFRMHDTHCLLYTSPSPRDRG